MARIVHRTSRREGTDPGARHRLRAVTLGAALLLAAVGLTACSDDDGTLTEAAATPTSSPTASSSPTVKESVKATAKATERPAAAKSTTHKATTVADKGSSDSGDAPVTCTGANLRATAQPVQRPINHLLITVKNTGTKNCNLYFYPAVRFGEAQSVPPVVEDSKPQAVVLLFPGDSAYAGVLLSSAEGGSGYTAKSLAVSFMNADQQFGSKGATPTLPSGGVFVDDSLRVTYWQSEQDDALTW